jgi:MYXO-CTERM domain-containing protein
VTGAATGGSGGAAGDGGIALAPDEKVVGGAFNCSAGGGAGPAELSVAACLAVALGGWIQRRRKRKVRCS